MSDTSIEITKITWKFSNQNIKVNMCLTIWYFSNIVTYTVARHKAELSEIIDPKLANTAASFTRALLVVCSSCVCAHKGFGLNSHLLLHCETVANFHGRGPRERPEKGLLQKSGLCLFTWQVWGGWQAGQALGASPNQLPHLGHWVSPQGCCTQVQPFSVAS